MTSQPGPDAAGDAARPGGELREARLALGLSVEDLAASLRIRRSHLVALEEGRARDLPAPAYALGFVRSYAGALGLDADAVVGRFRDGSGTAVPGRTGLAVPAPGRGLPTGAVILVGAVLASAACLVGWHRWSGGRTADAVPLPPARAEQAVRQASPPEAPPAAASAGGPQAIAAAASPPALALPVAAASAAPPRPAGQEAGRLVLRARAETWVQVRDRPGGPILVNRVMQPGETWAAPARDGLLLSAGNAAGLEILLDGQPVPGLTGNQAVRRDVPLDPNRLKAGIAPPAAPQPTRPAAQ